jgi:energy-coupling factor transporter ATP-binding protein EcfA2
VPEALDEVVLKAAALDPADRYATAGDCAAAARRALERDPVPAVAPTRLLSRPRRRSPFPEALSAGLAARVRTLCADITARLDDSGPREAISRVRRELDEPLKLAIAGRTGVGKSTLTNALLGRRIAQTGPGETTRLVSWYRYGFPERVEVVLQDGNRIRRGLGADGTVPDDLGIDLTLVESVDVWLQNDTLQAMTIIDTPGLSSLSTALSSRSKRLIGGSDAALARADALLFVMAGDAREDDEEALEMFSASCRAADRASAVNLVGVLSKADRAVGHAPDLSAAQRIADRIHRQLGQLVSTVVPVASLLAETANTGSIREAHAGLLRTLAASAGPAGANGGSPAMLASVSAFLDAESPVPRRDREELIDLLGLFGIRRAFELAAAGRLTGVEFVRLLRERSGIEDLRRQIDGFGLRADALKADAALRQLDQLSFADRRLQFVRSEVAQVRREPDMHVLELFRSLDRVASGRVDLPIELIEELQRLITARTLATRLGLGAEAATGELMAAASERHRVWKTFENDPSTGPAAARAAFPVIRAYEILLDQARQAQERGRHESLSPQ